MPSASRASDAACHRRGPPEVGAECAEVISSAGMLGAVALLVCVLPFGRRRADIPGRLVSSRRPRARQQPLGGHGRAVELHGRAGAWQCARRPIGRAHARGRSRPTRRSKSIVAVSGIAATALLPHLTRLIVPLPRRSRRKRRGVQRAPLRVRRSSCSLVPATAMGATLPVLVGALAGRAGAALARRSAASTAGTRSARSPV